MLRRAGLFLSILALFGACTKSADDSADLSVDAARESSGVVYGKDSTVATQKLLKASLDPRLRANIRASGAIVPRERFLDKTGSVLKLIDQSVQERYNVCSNERLAGDLSASLCSGVLIGPRQFLTVAHCFETFACADVAIAFDYRSPSLEAANVYSCEAVRPLNPKSMDSDLVVITLDRDVTGRDPVEYHKETVSPQEPVYTISHPLGTSQKWSSGQVRRLSEKKKKIETSLDVFTGSSGAPVFSKNSHQLIGLVTDGEEDFLEGSSCLRYKVCPESGCLGEDVTPL